MNLLMYLESYLSFTTFFQMKRFSTLCTDHFRWFREHCTCTALRHFFSKSDTDLLCADLLHSIREGRHSVCFKLCSRTWPPREMIHLLVMHPKLLLSRSLVTSALLNLRANSQSSPCSFKAFDHTYGSSLLYPWKASFPWLSAYHAVQTFLLTHQPAFLPQLLDCLLSSPWPLTAEGPSTHYLHLSFLSVITICGVSHSHGFKYHPSAKHSHYCISVLCHLHIELPTWHLR